MIRLIVILFLCTKVVLIAAPAWYVNRELQAENQMVKIGYGDDTELQNAIVIAKADISSQLESQVQSTISIQKIRADELFSHSVLIQNLHTESVLEDLQIIRQEYSKDEAKWFVAITYENVPDIKRFVKKLPANLRDEHQNTYFTHTYIGKELNNLTKAKTDSKLCWMNERFYLNYRDIYQKMTLSTPDVFITHATNSSNKLDLIKKSPLAGIMINNEKCEFKFTSSKQFVSLFVVNPEGHVFVLEDNIPTYQTTLPYQFFRKDNQERPTMFVAVFSDSKVDNSFFRMMIGNEERDSYENGQMKFDRFIEFLDNKDFVSKKLFIK